MKLEITFKSGAQILADVEDNWKFEKRGTAVSLTWTTPDRAQRRLVHVDMEEVVAIVRVR